jgi:hypothetical protein
MMNEKKWLKVWVTVFLLFPLIALFNYVIDPYGLNQMFSIRGVNYFKKSNTGYTYRFKTNIVMDNEFETLLLGTSRTGVMDPDVVKKYREGEAFSFDAPISTIEMQYKIFKYVMEFNDIKNLIYGVDFMSFNGSRLPKVNFKEFTQLEENIVEKKRIYNFDIYFNWDTFKSSWDVIYRNITNKSIIVDHYRYRDGMRIFSKNQHLYDGGNYPLQQKINDSFREFYNPVVGVYKNYKFSNKHLDYFRKIIEYCKEHNIKVWVYIPPMTSEHFDSFKSAGYYDKFEHFKRELVNITPFVDFTGHNTITNNNHNYWDSSHLRPELTEPIMARLFNDKSVDIPSDFGVMVTKDNIEEHLKDLKNQLEDFDLERALKEH